LPESRAIAQYIIAKYRGQGTELAPPESDLKAYALYQQVCTSAIDNSTRLKEKDKH
jgi:glutathione S-transferase